MKDDFGMQALKDWAKGRLDEMDAAIGAMEARSAELQDMARGQTAKTLGELKQWREEFDAKARDIQQQGEEMWTASQRMLESVWENFERSFVEWMRTAEGEGEVFEARVRSQVDLWRTTLARFAKQAEQAQAQHQERLRAEVARASREAEKAHQRLSEAGAAGWTAMIEALDVSRGAFEKAADDMRKVFGKHSGGR